MNSNRILSAMLFAAMLAPLSAFAQNQPAPTPNAATTSAKQKTHKKHALKKSVKPVKHVKSAATVQAPAAAAPISK